MDFVAASSAPPHRGPRHILMCWGGTPGSADTSVPSRLANRTDVPGRRQDAPAENRAPAGKVRLSDHGFLFYFAQAPVYDFQRHVNLLLLDTQRRHQAKSAYAASQHQQAVFEAQSEQVISFLGGIVFGLPIL